MVKIILSFPFILFLLIVSGLSGCSSVDATTATSAVNNLGEPAFAETTTEKPAETIPSPTNTPSVTELPVEAPIRRVWISEGVPASFTAQVQYEPSVRITHEESLADILIIPVQTEEIINDEMDAEWVYLLAAPFPTLTDGISQKQLLDLWSKGRSPLETPLRLAVSGETLKMIETVWGAPSEKAVFVQPAEDLLETAWEEGVWAIIPFEEIDPRWKVLRIDGVSPIDTDFVRSEYPLTFHIGIVNAHTPSNDGGGSLSPGLVIPKTNFEPEKLTSLILTGTTALARYTAQRMEENGVLYPARDIVDLLLDADFTHISNEVPFDINCPPANPVRLEARFCSDPKYFELFEYIDADVIELTGNHILDWGAEPLLYTIELYEGNEILYYGGGKNLEDARKTLFLQTEYNKLALLGCSQAGPEVVWATGDSPGSNPCDPEWLQAGIEHVYSMGGIPVVTFQHLEVEDYTPHSSQRIDFLHAAEIGAVIVSGSQSHFAQTMTFVGDHFVHYGLGNLFFDQMYGENPKEFIDRHFFYGGRYISTELITTILEDAAKPRLMDDEERAQFLTTIFERCNWSSVFTEQ